MTVALTERTDEDAQMVAVIKKLRAGVEAPIVINSTKANVIEAALKAYPGRPVVNSINMERGRERIEAVVPNVVEHGAAVVVMPMERGRHGEDRGQVRPRSASASSTSA